MSVDAKQKRLPTGGLFGILVRELLPTYRSPIRKVAIIATPRAIIILAKLASRGWPDVAASAVAVSKRPISAMEPPIVPVHIIMGGSWGSWSGNLSGRLRFIDHICSVRRRDHVNQRYSRQTQPRHQPQHWTLLPLNSATILHSTELFCQTVARTILGAQLLARACLQLLFAGNPPFFLATV